MNREEPQFTIYENPIDKYPLDCITNEKEAFIYFTYTTFYQQTGGDIKCALSDFTMDKVYPFRVIEYKREGKESVFLIVRVESAEPEDRIKYAFFIFERVVYPAPTLSGVICYKIDSIMASIIDLFERMRDSVRIDPLKGYVWNGVPEPLEDVTTPLPDQTTFINERNVSEAINSFLKTNP